MCRWRRDVHWLAGHFLASESLFLQARISLTHSSLHLVWIPDLILRPRPGSPQRTMSSRGAGVSPFPQVLIEVYCEKQTGLVFEERLDPHHVSALQVVDNDLIADGDECLTAGQRWPISVGRRGSAQVEAPGADLTLDKHNL